MIKEIVDLLNNNDFYDIADSDIQFAKGAYNFPTSVKKLKDYRKRQKALRNGR
jgi:hypothetical protein